MTNNDVQRVASKELQASAPENAGLGPARKTSRETFAKFLVEEKDRVTNCSTMPCTILLFATFSAVVWMHGNVQTANHQRSAIYAAVDRVRAPHTLGTGVTRTVRFSDITDAAELWSWVGYGLMPLLSGRSPEEKPTVRSFNVLLGGEAMMTQRRVKAGGCRVSAELVNYYGQDCFSPKGVTDTDPFGIMPYAAQDSAFLVGGGLSEMVESEAAGLKRDSRFFAWLDAVRPVVTGTQIDMLNNPPGQDRAAELFQAGWIDDATIDVNIEAAFLNAEVGYYTHLSVKFSFVRGGLAQKTLKVKPLAAKVFPTTMHIVLDLMWGILMLVLFINTLQAWADSQRRGCWAKLSGDPWLALDCVASLWGIVFILFFILFALELGKLEGKLSDVPRVPPVDPATIVNATALERTALVGARRAYRSSVAAMLYYINWCAWLQDYNLLGMFWYVSAIMLRFFRGFSAQPRISTIGQTICRAGNDLIHLGIILLVVFGNFVLGGCVLFGPELEVWSSYIKAGRSTFAVVWGSGNWYEMHEVMPMSAIIWLFCFVVIIVFIMNNIFLSLIIYFHSLVQEERGGNQGQSLIRQLVLLLGDWWWSFSYKCRVVYRFLYKRAPPWYTKRVGCFPDEESRVSKVPFDLILANLGQPGFEDVEGLIPELAQMPAHEFVTITFLERSGCDEMTANRLFAKCFAYYASNPPNTYPVATLSHEFEGAMNRGYTRIDNFNDEICNWMDQQHADYQAMLERQGKIQRLSEDINEVKFTPPPSYRYQPQHDSTHEAQPALGDKPGDAVPALEDQEEVYGNNDVYNEDDSNVGGPRALAPS
jgi:hypothetical protein